MLCWRALWGGRIHLAGVWWAVAAELQLEYSIWPKSSQQPAGVWVCLCRVLITHFEMIHQILDSAHVDVRVPSHVSPDSPVIILFRLPFTLCLLDFQCFRLICFSWACLFLVGMCLYQRFSVLPSSTKKQLILHFYLWITIPDPWHTS